MTHDDCLFCKIIRGEVPAKIVFENDRVMAFKDINPQAPIHLIFIHRKHSENMNASVKQDIKQVMEIFSAITEYTEQAGLDKGGFRVVTNTGIDAGQTIFHTHFHVLSGKKMGHLC